MKWARGSKPVRFRRHRAYSYPRDIGARRKLRVLIASDKFKGTLDAPRAVEAIARGVLSLAPEPSIQRLPLADGGEGTLDLIRDHLGGDTRRYEVTGPLGDRVSTEVALVDSGRTAVVETARASGLSLVSADRRDALAASSVGTGELLVRVLGEPSVQRVLIAIGGTASTDGGTGAATALGWRFIDEKGVDLPPGGGSLARLGRIESPQLSLLGDVEVVGLCDVGNPLLGPEGAARAFGPQKGAAENDIDRLEEGLTVLSDRINSDLGVQVGGMDFAGAGGGIAAGIVAFLGGRLVGGFDYIAELVALRDAVMSSDLVITGEGRLDSQSLGGKVTGSVAKIARELGKPCFAVVGNLALDEGQAARAGFVMVVELRGKHQEIDAADAIAAASKELITKIRPA